MPDLSIIIPSKNEEFLQKTIEDIFEHVEGDTEVLVGIDGKDGGKAVDIPRVGKGFVTILLGQKGQRAITNELVRHSRAKYIMKVDAHTSFQQGFDVAMMKEMDNRTILAPLMGVLEPNSWTINGKKMRSHYKFGRDFIMQYDDENEGEETMCLQGSAWMITRENYWNWNVCDETLGSWGAQGVELGIAAYLNGGRCKTTREAYYGHVFRHTDEEFPYDRGEDPGGYATRELKRRYEDKIGGLIERFNYPLDWSLDTQRHLEDIKSLKPGEIAIDCGANVGVVTRLLAETGATVYAFEPDPTAFVILQAQFPKLNVINKAVSNRNGKAKLYLHKGYKINPVVLSISSSLYSDKDNVDETNSVEVEVVDIGEFIENLSQPIGLLKLDVEGEEVNILNALIDSGISSRIRHILVETHERIPSLTEPTKKLKEKIERLGIKNIDLTWV